MSPAPGFRYRSGGRAFGFSVLRGEGFPGGSCFVMRTNVLSGSNLEIKLEVGSEPCHNFLFCLS